MKKFLYENVVLAIQKPELFRKYGKKLGVGLLLYGPPGTGKTHVVNAIAGESGANVIIARINQIVDMYTGNTEKNLHAIFEQARKNPPCIIFFDELDALGVKRGGGGGGEGGETLGAEACGEPVPCGDERRGDEPGGHIRDRRDEPPVGHRPGAQEERKVRRQRST